MDARSLVPSLAAVPLLLFTTAVLTTGSAQAQPEEGELDRVRMLEILRDAQPPPVLPESRTFSAEESHSAAQRATAGYDLATGEETFVAGIDATFVRSLPPDPPLGVDLSPPAEILEGAGPVEFGGAPSPFAATPPSALADATPYPWSTIYKLLMRFNVGGTDYYYVCSAWSAGSFHLVTAGHCIYNWDPNGDGSSSDADWADEVWAWAAQGDVVNPVGDSNVEPDRPFGEGKGVYLRSYSGWTSSMNYDHDWGVITLNRRDGDHTGWMGRETNTTSSLNFSGYPVETPYVPSGTVVQYYGFDANNVNGYTCCRIGLDAYVYGGHSGGPSWRYDSGAGDRWVEGIHSTSDRMGAAYDTYLTSGKRSDLNTYMSDDETARPPTARPDLIEYFFDGNNRKDISPNAVAKGGDLTVEYNLLNSGFASSGTVTVDFYLSANTFISTSDTFIGSRTLPSLSAYTASNPTTVLTIPTSVSSGTYYVGWIASGTVAEYATGNNTAVIADETVSIFVPSPTDTPTLTPTPTNTPGPPPATCGAAPASGCAVASKEIVKIKNTGDAGKNQILWKLVGGTAAKAEFGDPVNGTTSYALCVYKDGSLIMSPVVTADGGWKEISKGFKYKNKGSNPDGIFKVLLKEGTAKAKILIKGKGSKLTVPSIPLNASTGVTVQLRKDIGSGSECWESVFVPPYKKDGAPLFKDKEP